MTVAQKIESMPTEREKLAVFPPLYHPAARQRSTHRSLFGDRFVLPNARQASAASLSLFAERPQAMLLRMLDAVSSSVGADRGLVEGTPLLQLREALHIENGWSALKRGTPGPYTKDCIGWGSGTTVFMVSKIAGTTAANALLENERKWLLLAQTSDLLLRHTPALASLDDLDGRAVLSLEPVRGARSRNSLSSAHLDLLRAVQSLSTPKHGFRDSRMQQQMHAAFGEIRGAIPRDHSELLGSALHITARDLPNELPMVAAHRDFVFWNIRQNKSGLCLMDWEYSCEQFVPLYDVFHFLCMPLAVKAPITSAQMRRILRQSELAAASLGLQQFAATAHVQALAYLLDKTLLHIVSRQGLHPEDKVMSAYLELIRNHDQWSRS